MTTHAITYTINDEYLSLLNQSISVLLTQCLGVQGDLSLLQWIEDERTDAAHLSAHVVSQLETVQQWASYRIEHLNSLATLDKTTKEQALWALSPCPLSLLDLARLLQQVNALAPGDIGRSYIQALLVGLASTLGDLAHNALFLIALHNRATNQTQQALPTREDIWQHLENAIKSITK
ncbi:hypothetical protein ACE4RU_07750 [Actinobacillus seminis]|uniref:hypothetical protein n=1 Tax=Actinobacillus seminis TaxID=722 RepID=UPI003B926A97